MSLKTVIYHNPSCSKSRQTLALLQGQGITPSIVEYLREGIDAKSLEEIVGMLGADASVLLRKKEDAYAESGLTETSTATQIIAAIVSNPKILERPIVVHGDRAALGRPPENILKILD